MLRETTVDMKFILPSQHPEMTITLKDVAKLIEVTEL